MKEFSLEEYLKNPDREVVTRDGRPARIICTDKCDTFGKLIIALIKCENGVENIHTYTSDGTYFPAGGLFLDFDNNSLDLFFAPTKH